MDDVITIRSAPADRAAARTMSARSRAGGDKTFASARLLKGERRCDVLYIPATFGSGPPPLDAINICYNKGR